MKKSMLYTAARLHLLVGLALSAAASLGAGFSGERFADIDLDENPVIVTNVTFDGLATLVDITNIVDSISTNFVPALRKEIADASEAGTNYVDSATNLLSAAIDEKYDKQADGIPKGDLSAGVQASLDKADTAVQPAALSGYKPIQEPVGNPPESSSSAYNFVNAITQDVNGVIYATRRRIPTTTRWNPLSGDGSATDALTQRGISDFRKTVICDEWYPETNYLEGAFVLLRSESKCYICTNAHMSASSWTAEESGNWSEATVADVLAALCTGKANSESVKLEGVTAPIPDSEWAFSPADYNGTPIEMGITENAGVYSLTPMVGGQAAGLPKPYAGETNAVVWKGTSGGGSPEWVGSENLVATRLPIYYILGDQADKPLQPAGDYVPSSRTINGAALTNDVTLTAEDIKMQSTGNTTVKLAVENRLDTSFVADKFKTNLDYTPGQRVMYESKIYEFTEDKAAGNWNRNVVRELKLSDLLDGLATTNYVDSATNDVLVAAQGYTDSRISEIPPPANYANVSNAAMNAASRETPTITNMIKLVSGNANWELNGGQTGWYFTDSNSNAYRIELNSDSNFTSNYVGNASDVLLASRKWVDDRLAGKASKSDATLTPCEFGDWSFSGTAPQAGHNWSVLYVGTLSPHGYRLLSVDSQGEVSVEAVYPSENDDVTSLSFNNGTVATRSPLGYQLGSQTNKVLASEAEAEALRTGKADNTNVVHRTGDEAIAGFKTFSNSPLAPYFKATFNSSTAQFYSDQIFFSANGRSNYLQYPDSRQSDYTNTLYGSFDVLATRDYVQWANSGKLDSTSAAPAWVSGTSYTANALVTYNGVVYRCKANTVSPHTATPDTDTTHWEAKPVSNLFLGNEGWQYLEGTLVQTAIGPNNREKGIYFASNPTDSMLWDIVFYGSDPDTHVSIPVPTGGNGTLALTAGPNHTGNLAALDVDGNPTDSGKKAGDFATAAQGTKADTAIQYVKVNGTALAPDTNKAVNVEVPVAGSALPLIDGVSDAGSSPNFSREDHVHPAETEVLPPGYALPASAFPVSAYGQSTSDPADIELFDDTAGSGYVSQLDPSYGEVIAMKMSWQGQAENALAVFNKSSGAFIWGDGTLTFNGNSGVVGVSPVLTARGSTVIVRGVEVANRVANATAGNLAALDANGNPTDSGKKPSDFLEQVTILDYGVSTWADFTNAYDRQGMVYLRHAYDPRDTNAFRFATLSYYLDRRNAPTKKDGKAEFLYYRSANKSSAVGDEAHVYTLKEWESSTSHVHKWELIVRPLYTPIYKNKTVDVSDPAKLAEVVSNVVELVFGGTAVSGSGGQ